MKLLTTNNTKTKKGEAKGYLTYILHLAPHTLSGFNTCPMASKGCSAACLNTAGMGVFSNVQASRIAKTKMFFQERDAFLAQLKKEIEQAKQKATKQGMKLAVRLNGTSDIRWELYGIIEAFPEITYYDYTKITNRRVDHLPNYHLTFSRDEDTSNTVMMDMLSKGSNVAVVFSGDTLPESYLGYPVVSGDDDDLRFLDPVGVGGTGVVVGLKAKGKAKKDTSGFVVQV